MKINTLLLVVITLSFFSCSDNKDDSNDNLSSEIIWQNETISIKNTLDSIPKVVVTGLQRGNKYTLEKSFLNQTDNSLLFSGTIKVLGDLNKDGFPEFMHEDLTENTDTIFGWRTILSIINNTSLQTITGTVVNVSKKCNDMVGSNESYSFDNTKEGGPYLVFSGKYGYATNCANYKQAHSKTYYTLTAPNTWLEQSFNCAIENNTLNLSNFYELTSIDLRNFPLAKGNFYDIYGLTKKLISCGTVSNDGYSHLEKLAGISLLGINNDKRTDLMPYVEEEFRNINPSIIKWINNNLIPSPNETQVNGLLYQSIYDSRYKEQIRKMAALKIIIMQQGVETRLRDYATITSTKEYMADEERIITKSNTDTYGYLEQKFYEIKELFGQAGFNDKYLESYDYGFIMRRMLDGSEPEIWNLTKSILAQYDPKWFQETIIDKKWMGVIELDSATYFQNQLLSGIDSIMLGKEAIPEGVAVENGAGITITCKNGKEVTFINNNSDGESSASYELKGYWPSEEIILIRYLGWEEGSTLLVDLNTGTKDYRSWELYPSEDGNYMAEAVDQMGYQAVLLQKKEGEKWVEMNEYSNQYIKEGFWVQDSFYFEGDKKYFTIGEIVL